MMNCSKLSIIFAFLCPLSKQVSDHLGKEFLCLNERNLNVSVRVAVKRELACNTRRQSPKGGCVICAQVRKNVSTLLLDIKVFVFRAMSGKQIVEFSDETADSRNELYESLRNQHHAEVVALLCTMCHSSSDALNDLIERHVLFLNFLRDQANIGMCLKSTLQSDV